MRRQVIRVDPLAAMAVIPAIPDPVRANPESLPLNSPLQSNRLLLWQRPAIQLAAAILVGLLLRLPGIGDGLNHDEAYTWEAFASRSLTTITTHYPVPNNHIFHSLLVHATSTIFGSGETALRLPALLAGLLAIPATWWLATGLLRVLDEQVRVEQVLWGQASWVALLPAWIIALSPDHADWSHAARGYTLIVLFSALSGGALIRAQFTGVRFFWLVYSVSLFLALYTQPSTALLAVGLAVWSVVQALRTEQRQVLTASLAAHGAVIAALLVAYGPIFDLVLAAGGAWGIDLRADSLSAMWGLLDEVASQTGMVVVLLAIVGASWLRQKALHVYWLFAGLLIAAFALPFAYGVAPQPRGYLYLLPWFAAVAAVGMSMQAAGLRRRLVGLALLLSLGSFSALQAVFHQPDLGWKELGASVNARTSRGELLVAPFLLDVEMEYYAKPAIARGIVTTLMDGSAQSLLWAVETPRFTLNDYVMSAINGERVHVRLPNDAFEKVSEAGSRSIYRLRSSGEAVLPDSWLWKAHPEEVADVHFGKAGPAVSEQLGLAVSNDSGGNFRIFSAARFQPTGPGICVLLSARTDPISQVSLYQADVNSDPEKVEEVVELSMYTTAAKMVEGVGRDQRLWHMEANLLLVDAEHEFGVFVGGSSAQRQDFADIRVLFFPFP